MNGRAGRGGAAFRRCGGRWPPGRPSEVAGKAKRGRRTARAACLPNDTAALEALMPDRWMAAHPEHRLEQREEESREAQARRRRKRAARRTAIPS